jgi:HK97 family phage portal protein
VIVSSFGQVQALTTTSAAVTSTPSYALYGQQPQSYLGFYKSQPNIRMCVEFLARNIAQLGIHVFRRVADDDRVRLVDHPLALTLDAPNPARTRYRLIEDLQTDMGIYFNAYWLKIRIAEPQRLGLVRLPPYEMEVEGGLLPRAYYWTTSNGTRTTFSPQDVVHFSGYGDALAPFMGISPLETLKAMLLEEREATLYRQTYWRNAARVEGVLTRQKDTAAGKWSVEQTEEYARQWRLKYASGGRGQNPGGTPILPVGMDFKTASFSARDSEYTQGGKLRREICAAEYHIPLPMVGILDHATFSNIEEQHKQTYSDCLGPWLTMYALEFKRQVLSEFEDREDVYAEFNIAEKLKGDFEEQAAALAALVGGPVMTINEARARLNLPRMDDPSADEVQRPLNMTTQSSAAEEPGMLPPTLEPTAMAAVQACWNRQHARLALVPPTDRAEAFDLARWNRELAADLRPIYASVYDDRIARRFAELRARQINTFTRAMLAAGHPVFLAEAA